jgi:uncharacterized protein
MTDAVAADFLPILSAAAAPTRSLIVSLHDVMPATQVKAAKILEDLKTWGVRTASLLVVPDYHGHGNAMENATFVTWLRDLEIDGYEIVLHGYFHQRPRQSGEKFSDKLLTRIYTKDEGEFFDLEYQEAFSRITRARDEFRKAGLSPVGFVAPAWLLSSEAERAARDAEMQYTTRLSSVVDLLTGKTQPAQSLAYSTRSAWRERLSLVWNAVLVRGIEIRQLVRLSIHPGDIQQPRIWRQIRRVIERLTRARNAITYRDWIEEQRINQTQA